MKTSSRLLLSVLLILIICIGIYNVKLKAAFLTAGYKNKYNKYKTIPIAGFTEVEVNATGMMEVQIIHGDFKVYADKHNQDSVTFTKVGNRLVVNINLPKKPEMPTEQETSDDGVVRIRTYPVFKQNRIVISCPNVSLIKTTNVFLVDGKLLPDYNYNRSPFSHERDFDISGFKLDSLRFDMQGNNNAQFVGNTIGSFNANTGEFGGITINKGNVIQKANLQINHTAKLELDDITIPQLTWNFSDSAKITLTGLSAKSFVKH